MNQEEREWDEKSNLFYSGETTMKADYVFRGFSDGHKRKIEERPKRPRPKYTPIKNSETITSWRKTPPPFSLCILPKPIIRTDPREIQKRFEKIEDSDREEVRKTRPRLPLPATTTLDGIEDDEVRDILIKDTYTTSLQLAHKDIEDTMRKRVNVKAPLLDTFAPAKPLKLPKVSLPVVDPGWRMESVGWDGRQLRATVDATKEFWLNRPVRQAAARKN